MSRSSQVWSNGKLIPFVEANVHMLSHGFSRGCAGFEVFGVHLSPKGPQSFRMDEHLKRLVRTCDLLGMHLAHSPSEIAEAVIQTATANAMANGYIKVMAYYSEISMGNLIPEGNLDLAIFALEAGFDLGLDPNKTVSACTGVGLKSTPRSTPQPYTRRLTRTRPSTHCGTTRPTARFRRPTRMRSMPRMPGI